MAIQFFVSTICPMLAAAFGLGYLAACGFDLLVERFGGEPTSEGPIPLFRDGPGAGPADHR